MAQYRPTSGIPQQQIRGVVTSQSGQNMSYRIPQPGLTGQPIIYAANVQVNQRMSYVAPHPRMCATNPQPQLTEEQLRLQYREHNYQIQQQRLRAFNTSNIQKNVNPDMLIESMFGKPTSFQQRQRAPQFQASNIPTNITTTIPANTATSIPQSSGTSELITKSTSESAPQINISENISTSRVSLPNNKKNLEEMLLECSDLMKPRQAHTFPKVSRKEDRNSLPDKSSVASSGVIPKPFPPPNESEIIVDQSKVETHTNNLGFPDWCFIDAQIPDLYRQVQKAITNQNMLDTDKLYPILVSSGLHRDILGHIWSLVNQTTPGQLLPHELYAALTLIALAQNGYKFSSLDILQSLARPLVPYLKQLMVQSTSVPPPEVEDLGGQFNSLSLGQQGENKISTTSAGNPQKQEYTDLLGFTPAVQKPPIGSSTVGSRLANYSVGLNLNSTRDQSSLEHSENQTQGNDFQMEEFADFQAASACESFVANFDQPSIENSEPQLPDPPKTCNQQEAKTNEDKYSIFRDLDRERHVSDPVADDDEFGEFLCVSEPKPEPIQQPYSVAETQKNIPLSPFQAAPQFTFKSFGEKSVDSFIQSSLNEFQMTSLDTNKINSPAEDPEFGAFMSTNDMADDNNSLKILKEHSGSVESQSVSSLELGPVDNGLTGGDNVSNLSRQASFHSLDFKTNLADDEGNGETHSNFDQKELASVNSRDYALDDPYRFVHGHTSSNLERNVYEWERCLESCYQLIQGANTTLSEITSASVFEEVINSDEGSNYLLNIVEIYRVVSRLELSIKTSGVGNDLLNKLLKDINTAWANLSSFMAGSTIMPSEDALDFSDGTLSPESENNCRACGVCLLNVNSSGKSRTKSVSDGHCLEFSGRQYHATCANFWVNCVNSLLPALTLQHRLLY